jgi:hypothetical protein
LEHAHLPKIWLPPAAVFKRRQRCLCLSKSFIADLLRCLLPALLPCWMIKPVWLEASAELCGWFFFGLCRKIMKPNQPNPAGVFDI